MQIQSKSDLKMRNDRAMDNYRTATIQRKTNETDIEITVNLDGTGKGEVSTGIGFFDHMLLSFAKHGLFDLNVKVRGDLNVDCHHTIEDTGIVLGMAIEKALGDKKGIKRYGSCILPMDEALVLTAVDLSGRPYLVFDCDYTAPMIGEYDTQMTREFFYAVTYNAKMNLHIKKIHGINDHHTVEACYKSFAKSLMEAVSVNPRITDVLSTKGTI